MRGGKREAQTALAEMVTEAERGLTVRTTATVEELLEAWFEFASPDFSPKTVKETRGYIDRSLVPALGSRPLAKLKSADLDAFYRRLLASGGSGGRPLAPGTVRRIHGILRRALNRGVKWGWIGSNPATATTPPRVPASDIKPPSAEALGRVLRRADAESPDLACYLMPRHGPSRCVVCADRIETVVDVWGDHLRDEPDTADSAGSTIVRIRPGHASLIGETVPTNAPPTPTYTHAPLNLAVDLGDDLLADLAIAVEGVEVVELVGGETINFGNELRRPLHRLANQLGGGCRERCAPI